MVAPRKIFLVGFMGCGKSTVGRLLAGQLEYRFLDLDDAVETDAGQSVREIFERSGEPEFRRREMIVLASLSAQADRLVVATGGGTFAQRANREWIATSGFSVFLDVPFEILRSRLEGKTGSRPLFRDEVQAFQLYSSRLAFYRMADLILEIRAGETTEEAAERIRLALPWKGRA